MAQILIADDMSISRDTLARVLREDGHRVSAVASGAEAVERVQQEPPDMAVLDLNMPRLSGLEAARQIKDAAPLLLPVMIVSGRVLGGAELGEVLAVAEDYLRKPYLPAEMCARVGVWLRTRRLFQLQAAARVPEPGASGLVRGPSVHDRIAAEWRRALRSSEPFALLLCESLGPRPNAAILGRLITQALREVDTVGLAGPTRVAAILPGTPPAGALRAAERLLDAVRAAPEGGPVAVGLALVPGRDISGPAALYQAAEAALERARAEGAFHLCMHQHLGYLVRSQP